MNSIILSKSIGFFMIWFSSVLNVYLNVHVCVGRNISIIFQQSDMLNLLYSYIDAMIK